MSGSNSSFETVGSKKSTSLDTAFMELDYILLALAALASDEESGDADDEADLIDQVYSIVIRYSAATKHLRLLAESLHRKWMLEPGFAPLAAKIIHRLRDIATDHWDHLEEKSPLARKLDGDDDLPGSSEGSSRPLWVIVYGIIWRDYEDRVNLRKAGPTVFAHCAQFLFDFWNLFLCRENEAFFQPLLDCIFNYSMELIDVRSTEQELVMFHKIYSKLGARIAVSLEVSQMNKIWLSLRRQIIEATCSPYVRACLMEILELSRVGFDQDQLSLPVRNLYKWNPYTKPECCGGDPKFPHLNGKDKRSRRTTAKQLAESYGITVEKAIQSSSDNNLYPSRQSKTDINRQS